MVLIRLIPCVLVLAACGQSLFDNNGGDDTIDGGNGSGDGQVPVTCPAPCIGDAAGDFPNGAPWRYLDDNRNRTWTPMAVASDQTIGTGQNKITTCAAQPSAPACAALPGALLVTATGATATADPAIEWTTAAQQVIQLSLRVHVPSGSPNQLVRLYRNAREDVLFTGIAMSGVTLEHSIDVDALTGDRFLVALAPSATGAADVAIHLFVSPTGAAFPSSCQMAVSFEATGNTVANACGAVLTHEDYNTGAQAPTIGAGPFPELGTAADLVENKFYKGTDLIDYGGSLTIQLWMKNDGLVTSYDGWAYSDLDLQTNGGLGIVVYDNGGLKIEATTCEDCTGNPLIFEGAATPYPTDGAWHFVRLVYTGGMVSMCLDGEKKVQFPAMADRIASAYAPRIGRNVVWTPAGAFWDGGIDDVRVMSTALPCN